MAPTGRYKSGASLDAPATYAKRLFHPAVLLLFVLIAAAILWTTRGCFYFRAVVDRRGLIRRGSHDSHDFPNLTTAQALNLGWAQRAQGHPQNSYLDYPRPKSPGTERIGFFGESYVAGAEAAYGQDFPTLLDEQFKRAGYRGVEVLNFGVPAYGMAQSYLMWKYLGMKYHLDRTVFFLYAHDVDRDDTFLFYFHSRGYGNLHARFILNPDGAVLVPLLGSTPGEQAANYYRFLQPWRYWRYDEREPMLLRVWSDSEGSRLNPFYYQADQNREIPEIYYRLFKTVAQRSRQLIICYSGGPGFIRRLRDLQKLPNVHFLPLDPLYDQLPAQSKGRRSNLYVAPANHLSALGNEATAAFLFNYFIGRHQSKIKAVVLRQVLDVPKPRPKPWTYPFGAYRFAKLEVGNTSAGIFVKVNPRATPLTMAVDLKSLKAAALLEMDSIRGYPQFEPLPFKLQDGAPVTLSFVRAGQAVHVLVGVIRAPCGVIGSLILNVAEQQGPNWLIKRAKDGQGFVVDSSADLTDAALSTQGETIPCRVKKQFASWARKVQSLTIDCSPDDLSAIFIRASSRQILHLQDIRAPRGTLDLTGQDPAGHWAKCPVLDYQIKTLYFPPFKR